MKKLILIILFLLLFYVKANAARLDDSSVPSTQTTPTIGDCNAFSAFTGACGTVLIFYNAGGNATVQYDGNQFNISKPIVVTGGITSTLTAGNVGNLKLYEDPTNGTNYIKLQAPSILAGDTTYTWPSAFGAVGAQLTDVLGNGTLSWVVGAGSGDVTGVGDCTGGACFDGTSDGGTYWDFYTALGARRFGWDSIRLDFHIDDDLWLRDINPGLWWESTDYNYAWGWHYHPGTNYPFALFSGPTTAAGVSLDNGGFPTMYFDNSHNAHFPHNNVTIGKDLTVTGTIKSQTIHIAQGTFDLKSQYSVDPDLWLIDLHADAFPNGIVITKIYVDSTVADPTTELTANLNYCDAVANGAFPGANATLIKAINTTTGNFADLAVNVTVPTGKTIYITMGADPTDANVQYHIRIHFYLPN